LHFEGIFAFLEGKDQTDAGRDPELRWANQVFDQAVVESVDGAVKVVSKRTQGPAPLHSNASALVLICNACSLVGAQR
jgi:hypothetical protein